MDEAMASRYWCHFCSRIVNPIMELEIKCPRCDTVFVEEVGSPRRESGEPDSDTGSDRALSLWAPILLGMMGNNRRRRRFRHFELSDEDDDREDSESRRGGEAEIDREIESIGRRRRSSTAITQILQGRRAGIASEYGSSEADRDEDEDGDRDEGGDGNRSGEEDGSV